nr:MAG TPA: hypothetical protein [Caudoviricetes sp.]
MFYVTISGSLAFVTIFFGPLPDIWGVITYIPVNPDIKHFRPYFC